MPADRASTPPRLSNLPGNGMVPPMEADDADPSGFPWSTVLLALLVLAAVAHAVPYFAKARTTAGPNSCVNNLRQIDGAKEQWALERQKAAGYPLTSNDVANMLGYLKGGQMPVCPANGTYTVGDLGQPPRCSVASHTL